MRRRHRPDDDVPQVLPRLLIRPPKQTLGQLLPLVGGQRPDDAFGGGPLLFGGVEAVHDGGGEVLLGFVGERPDDAFGGGLLLFGGIQGFHHSRGEVLLLKWCERIHCAFGSSLRCGREILLQDPGCHRRVHVRSVQIFSNLLVLAIRRLIRQRRPDFVIRHGGLPVQRRCGVHIGG